MRSAPHLQQWRGTSTSGWMQRRRGADESSCNGVHFGHSGAERNGSSARRDHSRAEIFALHGIHHRSQSMVSTWDEAGNT